MKTYFFSFSFPRNPVYCTAIMNKPTLLYSEAHTIVTDDPEREKTGIEDGFNQLWESSPAYRGLPIWQGRTREQIIALLTYQEWVPLGELENTALARKAS